MVRRRHRGEGRQVPPRAAQRAHGGGEHATAGLGEPAAASLPRRPGVRLLRSPGDGRRDGQPRRHGARAGRAARAPRRGPRSPRRLVRAVGRARLAGRARGRGGPDRGDGSRSWPSSSRSRTASGACRRRGSWPASAAGGSSTRCWPTSCAPTPRRSSTGLDSVRTWDAVIEAEPALAVVLSGERFDAALLAIATFVDLKSPYTLGHARAVADLAAQAGAQAGASESAVRSLRRAGLVHGLGRLGVSNSIWDKRGPLGAGEWERVRIHPYLTERMLYQSEALAPLGAIAVQQRERLDGSGYPARAGGRRRSRGRRGSSAPPTPTRRCASRGRTGRPARPTRRPRRCAPMSRPAAATPRPSRPSSAPPAIGWRGDARGRRASPPVRSRSSRCWPRGCRTRRPPGAS